MPAFGSKDMSSKVAKAFSHVIYTDIKNKKHVAYSSSTALSNVLTKSRTDFCIEDLPNPSLIPLFKGDYSRAKKLEETKGSPAATAVKSLSVLQASLKK